LNGTNFRYKIVRKLEVNQERRKAASLKESRPLAQDFKDYIENKEKMAVSKTDLAFFYFSEAILQIK
jgi:hypothetical protein